MLLSNHGPTEEINMNMNPQPRHGAASRSWEEMEEEPSAELLIVLD